MFNYTKFIYLGLSNRPSQAPSQTVDQNLQSLSAKARKKIETQKQRAERLKKNEDELFNYWLDNGKRFSTTEDSFIYESFSLKNKSVGKEAFLLLSLIKKYWGKEKAKQIYDASWKGNNFSLDALQKFLSGNEAKAELGIYWKSKKHAWYVWDNRSGSRDIRVGLYLHLNWEKAKGGLKNKAVEYLVSANRRNEVSSFIETTSKKLEMSSKDISSKIIEWAKKNAVNKWQVLPDDIHGYMRRMYGKRTGYYVYRYNPDKKRLYAMRIKGANLQQDDGTAAYMDFKNGEFGIWNGYRDGEAFIKSEVIGDMSPVDIEKEIVDYKDKENPGSLTKEQKLFRTKGIIATLSGLSRRFSYENLDKNYLDVAKKKLIAKLTPNLGKTRAKEYADLRITQLKEDINKYIDSKPNTLKKAVEDNPAIKFKVSVNSDDKVEVKFARVLDRVKYGKFAKEAKEKLKGTDINKLIDQKFDSIKGKLGPLAGFLKMIGIDIKKEVSAYYKTGKKSIILSILGLITSVDVGRRVLMGKSVDSLKDLEKLAKKNKGVLRRDHKFKKDLLLAGYKIVIPKGKGIKPGSAFNVDVKGKGSVIASPFKKKGKKGKFSFLSFFKKKAGDKFVLKDTKFTILNNTKIPKGTIIPKGAKIEKV